MASASAGQTPRGRSRAILLRDLAAWVVVSVLAGFLGGFFVFLIEEGLSACAHWRGQVPLWLIWALPAGGSALVGLVLWRLGPEAEGEPLPKYIHAVNRFSGRIPFAFGAAAILGAFVTLGSGGSGGTTGPVVLAAAFLASEAAARSGGLLRRLGIERDGRSLFAISAAAAAISAILRAPVGGGFMAVEILFRRNLETQRLFSAILASVSGYLVFVQFSGDVQPLFHSAGDAMPGLEMVPWVLGLVVAVELMSDSFVYVYRRTRALMHARHLPPPVRLGLGGLVVGTMAVGLTFLGTQTGWFDAGSGRAIFSTSREYMLDLVGPSATGAVGLGAGTVAIFLVAKLVATSVTVGSGNIAGFVLPTVLLGALAGHLASILGGYDAQLNATEHATLLAAGIAAAIAGTLNCPLAAILIVVEFFGLPFAWVAVLGGILGYKLSPETAVYSLETERAKILVVDDDGSIRRVVRKLLEKSGFGVGECGDGETALQVLGRERYDLLLLDRSLPGQSGDDVLETIRATPALEDLIVVMLTARKATEDRIEGLSEGADDYITKPFNLEELRARVEQHLRRKRREFSTILR